MNAPLYLDHNATTPVAPEVLAAMDECYRQGFGNPSSQHAAGRQARQLLEDARERIAELLGARLAGPAADRLIFTSGATEANNLALFGLTGDEPARIAVARIEHPSVINAARELERRGWQVDWLSAQADGVVALPDLQAALEARPKLVCLMLANSETGVLQPVAEAASLASEHNVPLHTDAVQAIGKLPVDFGGLMASSMSIAAHKFQGPRGIGALLVRGGAILRPLLFGGEQQQAARPGTECVALAVGMCRALELRHTNLQQPQTRIAALRDRLEQALSQGCGPVVIHGADARRLPNTSNLSFPGVDRQMLVLALDLAGVACSTGSACASGSSAPSPTLTAMGLPREWIDSAIRLSLGADCALAEVDQAADRITAVVNHLRHANSGG